MVLMRYTQSLKNIAQKTRVKLWNWLLSHYLSFVSLMAGAGFFFIAVGVSHGPAPGFRTPRAFAAWQFEPLPIGIGAGLLVFSYLVYREATRNNEPR